MLVMSKSLISPPLPVTFPRKTHLAHNPPALSFQPRRGSSLVAARSGSNEAGMATVAVESKNDERAEASEQAVKVEPLASNGAVAPAAVSVEETVLKFKDSKWVGGTWDLNQFVKDGKIDWDDVIIAEAKRRKWLEDNPETTNNNDPVLFSTSVIPWWAWIKRYHLGEAELLNGRAAMIGFFMAYIVDSLTGVGIVGQTGNFFCKTLLFIAVAGVLLIRKKEDIENLKKLFEETTFYDKQWQASWQDENTGDSSKK